MQVSPRLRLSRSVHTVVFYCVHFNTHTPLHPRGSPAFHLYLYLRHRLHACSVRSSTACEQKASLGNTHRRSSSFPIRLNSTTHGDCHHHYATVRPWHVSVPWCHRSVRLRLCNSSNRRTSRFWSGAVRWAAAYSGARARG